ncbi:TPA: hypothetical protein ENS27_01370, partial [bacterium]|nr:hypothetical protein [bacterium]
MIKAIFSIIVSLLLTFCAIQSSMGEKNMTFPSVELSNGIIKMGVYLPDSVNGYYRGTRFDWSGVISQVEYNGHTYFDEWKDGHDPNNHDDITGPVEEFRSGSFDTPSALGYNEAKPYENFIKIGIGILQKIDEPSYRFWYPYRIIEAGKWVVNHGEDWIEFVQDFSGINGWSYLYTKKIELSKDKPEFIIYHSLKNNGKRDIETSQYNHNFFMIDKTPVGTDYLIKFPFNVKIMRDLKGSMEAKDGDFYFVKNLGDDESLFTELEGFSDDPNDYDITILNKKTNAGVRITCNKPLAHVNFWTVKRTVCPEPFVSIDLAP